MATLAQALGLCRRAGKLHIGAALAADALKKGKTKLVILAADAAPNTEKKLAALAVHHGARVVRGELAREALAKAIGKNGPVGAVGVGTEFYELVTRTLKAD